jgi:biopolymer transport protein ExbB
VQAFFDMLSADRDFLETGGSVLMTIVLVTFLMWTLLFERFWYGWKGHPVLVKQVIDEWNKREETTSWYAHQIRNYLVSRVSAELNRGLPMIASLVALCPLLGLLGTVTGMIEVFDVMALAGSGNPRAMASGVAKATIPTMAGMVAALSGLILSTQLQNKAKMETQAVADRLSPGKE